MFQEKCYDCPEVCLAEVLTDTPSLLCYSYAAAQFDTNNRINVDLT